MKTHLHDNLVQLITNTHFQKYIWSSEKKKKKNINKKKKTPVIFTHIIPQYMHIHASSRPPVCDTKITLQPKVLGFFFFVILRPPLQAGIIRSEIFLPLAQLKVCFWCPVTLIFLTFLSRDKKKSELLVVRLLQYRVFTIWLLPRRQHRI